VRKCAGAVVQCPRTRACRVLSCAQGQQRSAAVGRDLVPALGAMSEREVLLCLGERLRCFCRSGMESCIIVGGAMAD
jgi:hypothetical protein